MKYIVKTWLTEEIVAVFDFEEELEEWLNDNVNYFSDGWYLDNGIQIDICED